MKGSPVFNSSDTIRVLVLANENSPIYNALMFLKKRGYRIKIIHRLIDSIQVLIDSEPDVLLMAWNLKRTDVRKAYHLFSSKFQNTSVIVFGEDNTQKSSASLMSSGIPNTLLPPVSGPGMHMRIQAILRKRDNEIQHRRSAKVTFGRNYGEALTPAKKGFENDDFDFTHKKSKTGDAETASDFADELSPHGVSPYTEVSTEQMPEDTKWSLFQAGRKSDDHVWQGVSEKTGKKAFYYFEGGESPTFNPATGTWDNLGEMISSDEDDPKKVLAQINDRKRKQKSAALFANDDLSVGAPKRKKPKDGENVFDESLLAELKEVVSEGKDIIIDTPFKHNLDKITIADVTDHIQEVGKDFEATTQLKTKDKKTSLAQGVHKAVATVMRPSQSKAKPIETLTKITVTMIKTPKNQGYLVGANASDLPDHELMQQVMDNLGEAMRDQGEPLDPQSGVLELDMDPLPFMLWVDSQAEFFVRSKHGDDEVCYAYVPFQNMPEVVAAKDTDLLVGIKHSSIFPGKPVLFDVFIHMPKNNKYLLYFKKGAKVETGTITKLIKFGVKHLFIKKSEVDLYQTYCAKYKIAESFEDFTPKKTKKAA